MVLWIVSWVYFRGEQEKEVLYLVLVLVRSWALIVDSGGALDVRGDNVISLGER